MDANQLISSVNAKPRQHAMFYFLSNFTNDQNM